MLVLGIILLVVGALIAYFGRPREQLIFAAGVIIFAIGAVLLLLWALEAGGVDEADAAANQLRASWGGALLIGHKQIGRGIKWMWEAIEEVGDYMRLALELSGRGPR